MRKKSRDRQKQGGEESRNINRRRLPRTATAGIVGAGVAAAVIAACGFIFCVPGGDASQGEALQTEPHDMEPEKDMQDAVHDGWQKEEEMTEICQKIYEKTAEEEETDDLTVMSRIISRFGENGYVAVDSGNQINMSCREQVIRFCERVEAGEKAELTMVQIIGRNGFAVYDMNTEAGGVEVTRSRYEYNNGRIRRLDEGSYQAEDWQYTGEGYLMFSGNWFSKQTYVLMLSGAEEAAAFRVQPLDESCREWNRRCILPIGYGRNNMFLTDWSEDDFGELDFYDLYDIFYPKVNGQPVPYRMNENLNVGAVYHIPEKAFEYVITAYFAVDGEALRSKTVYDPRKEAYEYRPRGLYETESSHPYPEVTAVTQNEDGTVTLTVNAVFPGRGLSRVYTHEVTVRPTEDGGVQYVSNHVLHCGDDGEKDWYTPRLTKEEWEEIRSLSNS